MKREALRNLPLFAGLEEPEVEILAGVAGRTVYPPGGTVFSEDRGGGVLFVIVRGAVRISKIVRFEERQTLSVLKDGEFFGEMSFLDGHRHSATAEAVGEAEIIEIARADFDALAARHPELAFRILLRLALQLSALVRKMDERFVEMVHYMWGQGKV